MTARSTPEQTLELAAFVPFRLNRLADGVSQHLAVIYRKRFGLDIPQWRVMATVGSKHGCTAQYIAASTRMHKSRVSRAIGELEARALIERASSGEDRRQRQVHLSRSGRRMYSELVPLALEREAALLACLGPERLAGFMVGIETLERFLELED
ncbi:MAG: MarR family winged helix-turn-helix transcriptional regulator [Steroidobacteraceae bacterium]